MQNYNGASMTAYIVAILFATLCSPILGITVTAQTKTTDIPKADARVVKALKETGTEYDLSSRDGMYKVTYTTTGKRTQTTLVDSSTSQMNGEEARLIFSFATISKSPPSQDTASMLLQENMNRIGRWGIQKLDDGTWAIVSLIYIPANSSGKQLEAALMSIATMADEIEEKLTKKDVN